MIKVWSRFGQGLVQYSIGQGLVKVWSRFGQGLVKVCKRFNGKIYPPGEGGCQKAGKYFQHLLFLVPKTSRFCVIDI